MLAGGHRRGTLGEGRRREMPVGGRRRGMPAGERHRGPAAGRGRAAAAERTVAVVDKEQHRIAGSPGEGRPLDKSPAGEGRNWGLWCRRRGPECGTSPYLP